MRDERPRSEQKRSTKLMNQMSMRVRCVFSTSQILKSSDAIHAFGTTGHE